MAGRMLEVCALNITANPHPPGIYVSLLRHAASGYMVKARGSDYAKITTPHQSLNKNYLYSGRLIIWTDIDIKGNWIDLNTDDKLTEDKKNEIIIPEDVRPNYRSFDYVFDESTHTFYIETRNEISHTLGPTTVCRIIGLLLSEEIQGPDIPDITVTILPEEGTVEKVLRLPRLRTLFIRVNRPNADQTSSPARRRVFEELGKANVKQLDQVYTKAAKSDHIEPTEQMREYAEVAAEDGFVRGEGKDEDGQKMEASTSSFPKRLFVDAALGGSFISKLLRTLNL